MKRRYLFALILGLATAAQAQLTSVTASSIKMAGVSVAQGTVTVYPVNGSGKPVPVTAGGTLYDPQGFTQNIVNGAISGTLNVPDECTAAPSVPNTTLYYNVEVRNTATNKSFTLVNVQGVCGASWALDSYVPTQSVTVSSTGLAYGATVPNHCQAPSVFYTTASPPVAYGCVGGVYVQQGSSASGALSYTTLTPAALSNTNVVGAGDSRMAGSAVPAGQGFLDYLALQPQFASRATFYNGANSGDTCALMTTRYVPNVQPHKPSGAITRAYLFIEVGINDINTSVALATYESCMTSYLTQAVSDGFTPVLTTVYLYLAATPAQDAVRIQMNDWIRQQPYFVIDIDAMVPFYSATPYLLVDGLHFNSAGNQIWAKGTNFLWGLDKSGTTFSINPTRNVFNSTNGFQFWQEISLSGDLSANASGSVSFVSSGLGVVRSNFAASNSGGFGLGRDGNCYLVRNWLGLGAGFLNGCGPFTIDNNLIVTGKIQSPLVTPASSSAACTTGQTVWDTGFIYICTATNTWKRAALSTF